MKVCCEESQRYMYSKQLYQTTSWSMVVLQEWITSRYVVMSLNGTDIAVIYQEIFKHDPLTRINNLKVCCEESEMYSYSSDITRNLST